MHYSRYSELFNFKLLVRTIATITLWPVVLTYVVLHYTIGLGKEDAADE